MTNSGSRVEDMFEFPVLTRILGPLNYRVLNAMRDELKSNAASVDSDLGGGANGHLGLVLTAQQYTVVSATTPYVRHVMPTEPNIPSNMPQHAAIRLRDDFKEAKRVFKEMLSVEKALLKQVSTAVPGMYLKPFRNKNSNTIDKPISDILDYLFARYGRVPQETLAEEHAKLVEKTFDISEPLVILYNEIDDLQDLAVAAKNPFSDSQLVILGMRLIKNTGDFEKGIQEWYDRTVDTDWKHFQSHFDSAQDSLRRA